MITVEEPGLLTTVCNGCGAKEGLIDAPGDIAFFGTLAVGDVVID